jgi:gamma-glutamylcyclotransferase (GGCT)/AIG2-like uncharacterized protein YtfP
MRTLLYFAYGSNLDEGQMRARCPRAKALGRAALPNHALTFGGFSHKWRGAVASIRRAPGEQVHGVLYRLPSEELAALDRFEGHPHSYVRESRFVITKDSRRLATVYVQPEETFEPWAPQPKYFAVLAREYARRGFALEHLYVAVGASS